MTDVKPELSAGQMALGVLLGLAAKKLSRSFDFYVDSSGPAMVAVFEYLQSVEHFDLTFYMCLGLHGDSPVWETSRAELLGLGFKRWTPGGPCEILYSEWSLEYYLKRGILPGDRATWLKCAEVFRDAYEQALRNAR